MSALPADQRVGLYDEVEVKSWTMNVVSSELKAADAVEVRPALHLMKSTAQHRKIRPRGTDIAFGARPALW